MSRERLGEHAGSQGEDEREGRMRALHAPKPTSPCLDRLALTARYSDSEWSHLPRWAILADTALPGSIGTLGSSEVVQPQVRRRM